MKPVSLLKLTAYENYRGQVLWIALAVVFLTFLMLALLADVALQHRTRLVDTTSYFLTDMTMFFTAILMGSQVYSRDFSNRGIAEIVVPSGMARTSLLLWRYLAHVLCLVFVLLILLMARMGAFVLADLWNPELARHFFPMFVFIAFKSALALAVAILLGIFARPVISLLGSLALFALGHFSSGISGLQGMVSESGYLSPGQEMLFRALRVWNPNYLVLESLRGKWEAPSSIELLQRMGWGFCAILVFLLGSLLAIRRKDIGAFRL